MKVYLLWETESYEPDHLIGIYSTRELAEKREKEYGKYLKRMEIKHKHLHIEERESDDGVS